MSEDQPGFKGLRLTNTLTRTKEDFVPIDPGHVRMYVCGPTVYDFAHIGNARPVIVFDVLFRLLRHLYGADHVTYVRNITDVDDKINARALRDFGAEIAAGRMTLNEAIRQVTETTAAQFHADVAALGCLAPDVEPRATEHIAGMVEMIETLLEKGNAYVAGGEVLFDVGAMPDYGALSKRNLEDQQAGARVAVDAHKKNPADFVLWKLSSEDEPGWDSPWGRGRPGWHIECSVMSDRLLWEDARDRLSEKGLAAPHQFDIHGGGLDLIFPHHENEIAQSRCAHGTPVMANTWLHNGFVQVEGRKMSKSEGNFVTIHDLLHTETFGGRKWPGEVLRLAMLMTHYREPIDFSVRRLEEADAVLKRWADIKMAINIAHGGELAGYYLARMKPEWGLLDDLNTSVFVAEVHKLANEARSGDRGSAIDFILALELLGFEKIEVFSQQVANAVSLGPDEIARIEAKIAERLAFIREKNWPEADRIRDELLKEGIQLKDSKDPETGERITIPEVKR